MNVAMGVIHRGSPRAEPMTFDQRLQIGSHHFLIGAITVHSRVSLGIEREHRHDRLPMQGLHRLIGKFGFAVERANVVLKRRRWLRDTYPASPRRRAPFRYRSIARESSSRSGLRSGRRRYERDQILLRDSQQALLAILTIPKRANSAESAAAAVLTAGAMLGELLFEFVGQAGDELFRQNRVEPRSYRWRGWPRRSSCRGYRRIG